MTEELVSKIVYEVNGGSYLVKHHPDGPGTDKCIEIDFTTPWKRVPMLEELERILKITFPKDLYSEEAR